MDQPSAQITEESHRTVANHPIIQSDWRRTIAAGLGLVALVLAVYCGSWRGGFVWDDLILVQNNPLATGALNLKTVWLGADFSLSTVVSWLEWLVFQNNAVGYRVVNTLLHLSSALLLWRLLEHLRFPAAWLGAAIFAVHPIGVASVAWISELKNTLSLPLCLLSARAFIAFVNRGERQDGRARHWFYASAVGCFGLALLAKTSVVVLPILLLAGLVLRQRLTRRMGLALLPFFGLALVFGIMTMWFQAHQAIRGITVQTAGWPERWADAGIAGWFYLSKALWPMELCAIYPSWEKSLPGLLRFGPLLGWGIIGGLALFYWRRWGRWVGLSLGAFLVCLLPVAGLVDMYFMVFSRVSDHFAYLSLVVIAGTAGAVIGRLRRPVLQISLGVLIVGSLSGLTWTRAKVYMSDESLWRDTLQKNPQAWNAHNNLACNLAERGQLEEALQHFQTSLELNPKNAAAELNLAKGLTLLGRFPEAEAHYSQAITLKPEDAATLLSYGQALAENQQLLRAAAVLKKAVALKPTEQTRLLLAAVLTALGRLEETAEEYQRVLASNPDCIEALNNLAWIRATATNPLERNGSEALRLAKKACMLTAQQQPVMLSTLAAAFAETGDFSNAVATAQAAIQIANAQGNSSLAERNRRLLHAYQSRQGATPKPK